MAFLFDGPNMGLDFSVGVGRVFNAMEKDGYKDFAETVLATNISFGKYWWLSGSTNLGLTIFTGLHGFTLTTGEF